MCVCGHIKITNKKQQTKTVFLDQFTKLLAGAEPGLTVGGGGGGAKYTTHVSTCEILCATPTFDIISTHDMLYEEKVNK